MTVLSIDQKRRTSTTTSLQIGTSMKSMKISKKGTQSLILKRLKGTMIQSVTKTNKIIKSTLVNVTQSITRTQRATTKENVHLIPFTGKANKSMVRDFK